MEKKQLEQFKGLPEHIRGMECHEFNKNKEKLALVVESLVTELETLIEDNRQKNKELENIMDDFSELNRKIQELV